MYKIYFYILKKIGSPVNLISIEHRRHRCITGSALYAAVAGGQHCIDED